MEEEERNGKRPQLQNVMSRVSCERETGPNSWFRYPLSLMIVIVPERRGKIKQKDQLTRSAVFLISSACHVCVRLDWMMIRVELRSLKYLSRLVYEEGEERKRTPERARQKDHQQTAKRESGHVSSPSFDSSNIWWRGSFTSFTLSSTLLLISSSSSWSLL